MDVLRLSLIEFSSPGAPWDDTVAHDNANASDRNGGDWQQRLEKKTSKTSKAPRAWQIRVIFSELSRQIQPMAHRLRNICNNTIKTAQSSLARLSA